MADNQTAQPKSIGQAKELDKFYTQAEADKKIAAVATAERAQNEAAIASKISFFEQDVLDKKIGELRALVIAGGAGVNYVGGVASKDELSIIQELTPPKHGDLYLKEGDETGTGYIWTESVTTVAGEEPRTVGDWVTVHMGVNLEDYPKRSETCGVDEFNTAKNNALTAKTATDKLGLMITQLSRVKQLQALPSTQVSASTVNALLTNVLEILTDAVNAYNGSI